MFTKEEVGLDQSTYNALKAAVQDPVWSVVAHRYNLDFGAAMLAAATGISAAATSATAWDAEQVGDYIFYANADKKVLRYQLSSNLFQDVTPSTPPTGNLKLSVSGTRIYLWSMESALKRAYTDNYGVSWSSWETGPSLTNYQHVAPVSDNAHLLYQDTSRSIFNLRYLDWPVAGAAVVSESDVWWTYWVASMDAAMVSVAEVTGASGATGLVPREVIVMETETPGAITARYNESTQQADKYWLRSGGLVSFVYLNSTWLGHYEIEVIDYKTDHNSREGVQLNVIDDLLYLSTWSTDGTDNYDNSLMRIYKSGDGQFWSRGIYQYLPDLISHIKLARSGDYVYAIDGRCNIWRSYSTYYTGHSPSAIQLDLTPYITEYSVQRQEMAQAIFTLDDADNFVTDHYNWLTQNTIALIHKSGYWINGTPVIIQTMQSEIDSIEESRIVPTRQFRVSARDIMAWMTDKIVSENAQYLEGQFVGADNFADQSNSNYGGLSHTAVMAGNWSTSSNYLQVSNATNQAIAFNTHKTDLYSGTIECDFTITTDWNTSTIKEEAGLVFYGVDANNLYYAVLTTYDTSAGGPLRLKLYQKKNNSDTLLFDVGLGSYLSATTNVLSMRIKFKYGIVTISVATLNSTGKTWFYETTQYLSALPINATGDIYKVVDNQPWKGYAGFVAKAQSGTVKFSNFYLESFRPVQTLTTAFKWYAALSDIHKIKTDFTYDSPTGSQTLSCREIGVLYEGSLGGTVNVTNTYGTLWEYDFGSGNNKSVYSVETARNMSTYGGITFTWKLQAWNGGAWIDISVEYSRVGNLPLPTTATSSDITPYQKFRIVAKASAAGPYSVSGLYIYLVGLLPETTYTGQSVYGYAITIKLPDLIGPVALFDVIDHNIILNYQGGVYYLLSFGNTETLTAFENGIATKSYQVTSLHTEEISSQVYYTDNTVIVKRMNTLGDPTRLATSFDINGQIITHVPSVAGSGERYFSIPAGSIMTQELSEPIDWFTLDPNESPIGGLNRAIEGRYLKFFMRGNSQLRAWNPRQTDSLFVFSDENVAEIGRNIDLRSIRTHVKQLGAYTWADFIRPDLIAKYGHRYRELSNPYLLTEAECRVQAELSIKRMEEQLEKINFATPYTPLLEPEDHIVIDDQDYIIESISLTHQPGFIRQEVVARKYVFAS